LIGTLLAKVQRDMSNPLGDSVLAEMTFTWSSKTVFGFEFSERR
jgi:hypothetical protein